MIDYYLYKSRYAINKTKDDMTVSPKILRSAVSNFCKIHHLSEGVRDSLEIDISYALIKYYPWKNCRLLPLILSDYLSDRYLISRKTLDLLFDDLMISLGMQVKSNELDHLISREFLLYIFVECATYIGEIPIEIEIGLGTKILSFYKKYSSQLSDSEIEGGYFEFETILDQLIGEISVLRSHMPWIMDLYRCNFRLRSELDRNDLPIDFTGYFNVLCQLGIKNGMKVPDLSRCLQDNRISMDVADALKLMNTLGLIYQCPEKRDFWRLTNEGLNLTAECAGTLLASQENKNWLRIVKMPEIYQQWACRLWPENRINALADLVQKDIDKLHPQAVKFAIDRLCSCMDKVKLEDLFKDELKNANKWQRRAIESALCHLNRLKNIRQDTNTMAESG